MAGAIQPLGKQFPIVNSDGTPNEYFIRWAQDRQVDIQGGITQAIMEQYVSEQLANLSLNDLIDVDTVTNPPANGQGLGFDSNTGLWVPRTFSGGGGTGSTPVIRNSNIQAGSASSYVVTWPVGTVEGDLAIIFASHGWGVNTPSGWIQINRIDGTNTNGATLAKMLTAADITAGSVNVTMTGSFNGVVACVTLEGATVAQMTTDGFFRQSGTGVASLPIPILAASPSNLVLVYLGTRSTSTNTSDVGTLVQSISATNASAGLYAINPSSAKFSLLASFTSGGSGYYVSLISLSGP